MHLRGITARISSVPLNGESFILNVLTTSRKMIPIKKTIARIIRQITGDYDYLERNQCFR